MTGLFNRQKVEKNVETGEGYKIDYNDKIIRVIRTEDDENGYNEISSHLQRGFTILGFTWLYSTMNHRVILKYPKDMMT